MSYTGNAAFIGVIYSPSAALKIGGNGAVSGAMVSDSAQLVGNGAFHYDESLGRIGPNRGFILTSWTEL